MIQQSYNSKSQTVTLSQPIRRGETEIHEITVNAPTVPALKGLKMLDVFQSDVDAMQILIPRITQPMLHKADFADMTVMDFGALVAAVLGFLAPTSDETTAAE